MTALSGGVNWSSYWTSLISATVEDAAPTNVVLTFPSGKPSLVLTDFSIAGKTISNATWVGAVLTLTVTLSFDWGDTPIITFVKTGQTANVTNNILYPLVLDDGNTVGWYDHDDLTTITKDGANRVSVWADKLGSGHNLLQATGANRPLWSLANGVLFEGLNDFMAAVPFAFIQPEFIYFVGRQVTWQSADRFFGGNAVNLGVTYQTVASPGIKSYAGTASNANNNLALNTFGIIRTLFNGANSLLRVNETAAVTGNFGAANMGGFTLGADGGGLSCGNIEAKEIILRKTADDATVQTAIYNYIKTKNGL